MCYVLALLMMHVEAGPLQLECIIINISGSNLGSNIFFADC